MFLNEKRLNDRSGLVKPVKFQLTGSQMSLNSRPTFKKTTCNGLKKRPMSASSLIMDFRDDHSGCPTRSGISPSWSRPQSADNFSIYRKRNRKYTCSRIMAGRCSSSLECNFNRALSDNCLDIVNDNDSYSYYGGGLDVEDKYSTGIFSNLAATYTLSSSKLIHNLVGGSSSDDVSTVHSPFPFDVEQIDPFENRLGCFRSPNSSLDHEKLKKHSLSSVDICNSGRGFPNATSVSCGSADKSCTGFLLQASKDQVDPMASAISVINKNNGNSIIPMERCMKTEEGQFSARNSETLCCNFETELKEKDKNSIECWPNIDRFEDDMVDSVDVSKPSLLASLEPGLVSKPPLPPTPDCLRNSKQYITAQPNNRSRDDNNDYDGDSDYNNCSVCSYDNDEIINLKFQRWFPNSAMKQGFDKYYEINNGGISLQEDERSMDSFKSQSLTSDTKFNVNSPSFELSTGELAKMQHRFFKNESSENSDSNFVKCEKSSCTVECNKDNMKQCGSSLASVSLTLNDKHLKDDVGSVSDRRGFNKLKLENSSECLGTISLKTMKGRKASGDAEKRFVRVQPCTYKSGSDIKKHLVSPKIRKSKKSAVVKLEPFEQIENENQEDCMNELVCAQKKNNKDVYGDLRLSTDIKRNFSGHDCKLKSQLSKEQEVNGVIKLHDDAVEYSCNQQEVVNDQGIINNARSNSKSLVLGSISDQILTCKGSDLVPTNDSKSENCYHGENCKLSDDRGSHCLEKNIINLNKFSDGFSYPGSNDKTSNQNFTGRSFINNDSLKENMTSSSENIALMLPPPVIVVTDEKENLLKESSTKTAAESVLNNGDSVCINGSIVDMKTFINFTNDVNKKPSTGIECHDRSYVYSTVSHSSNFQNSTQTLSNDYPINADGVIKKLIKTSLAVSSEYIIKTIKPKFIDSKETDDQTSRSITINGYSAADLKDNNRPSTNLKTSSIDDSNRNEVRKLPGSDLSPSAIASQEFLPTLLDEVEKFPERDSGEDNGCVMKKIKKNFNKEGGEDNEMAEYSDDGVSTYDDIVSILKVLEEEEEQADGFTKSSSSGISTISKHGCDDYSAEFLPDIMEEKSGLALENGCNDIKRENLKISCRREKEEEHIDVSNFTSLAILNYLETSDHRSEEAVKIKLSPEIINESINIITPSPPLSSLAFKSDKNKTQLITKCVEENDPTKIKSKTKNGDAPSNQRSDCLTKLLLLSAPELAEKVMFLSSQLEQKNSELYDSQERFNNMKKSYESYKNENESVIKRHQAFINQILNEKKQLANQCSTIVKEIESKHLNAVKTIKERHKVELKKACDKTAAAEKIKRDRWIDMKTKKIKELTVKGLEPELNRMAAVHQGELAELRSAHQRQIEEAEATFNRRLAAARIQADVDREQAVLREREAARSRLDQEIVQLEKTYQEQRKKLFAEVRKEREQTQKENCRILAEKESSLQNKLEKLSQETQEKQERWEKCYQAELDRMRGVMEAEKEAWISRQKVEWMEKEKVFREECKRERDKEIDLAIRKLETEAFSREEMIQTKLRREKERYEVEIREMDSIVKKLREKLKEKRDEINTMEEKTSQLCDQLNKTQMEYDSFKKAIKNQVDEKDERVLQLQNNVKKQSALVKQELERACAEYNERIYTILSQKERDLQRVFVRVKEVVAKKDETVSLVEKQRNAAIERCCQLEKLLYQKQAG